MVPRPMLAASATALPVGPAWTYEVKWDGYRALAVRDDARVQIVSRNEKSLTRDFPTVVSALAAVKAKRFVLDGEVVALDAHGRPSFQALQHRATAGLAVVYYAFDVLSIGDESLLRTPLEERRQQLRKLLRDSRVFLSEPLPGTPWQIEKEIRGLGLEGVVAKRGESLYKPGERSDAWIKVKFSPRQEFVIGGYKPNGTTFESVLVGYYDAQKKLHYAAKVRAGLTPHLRGELLPRLAKHAVVTCPFSDLPNRDGRSRWGEGIGAEDMKTLRWVKPTLVVEVAFVEWTRDGLLRHAQFVGVREDKKAGAVRRET
jgi:bifunctional non-homologous end joining protein LigD